MRAAPLFAAGRRAAEPAEMALANLLAVQGESTLAGARLCLGMLALPFDAAREQYGNAVRAGLFPASALASRDVELALDALERVTLGPLARHT